MPATVYNFDVLQLQVLGINTCNLTDVQRKLN